MIFMLEGLFSYFAHFFLSIGYVGILVAMAVESSFIPLPSEVIMIPAGYYASSGMFNVYLLIFLGTLGSVIGALINYYIAFRFGRTILHKNAKYLFTTEQKLDKIEGFFRKHGSFSTFVGRLIPGVRHYISIPAGLSKMNIYYFVSYTALGSFIWVSILTYLGYSIGSNSKLLSVYLKEITLIMLLLLLLISIVYVSIQYSWYSRLLKKKE